MIMDLIPQVLVDNVVIRVLLAAILGACIGLERDIRGRSAGLRTNILVSVGSAVFMLLSIGIANQWNFYTVSTGPVSDPTRMAAQIITGIGFLGAGAIIKHGFSVQGLTTAACLWIASAIGMSCGAGYYDIGLLTTIIAIFVLTVLSRIEKFYSKDAYRILEVTTVIGTDIDAIMKIIAEQNIEIISFNEERRYCDNIFRIKFNIRMRHRIISDHICHTLFDVFEQNEIPLHSVVWKHR